MRGARLVGRFMCSALIAATAMAAGCAGTETGDASSDPAGDSPGSQEVGGAGGASDSAAQPSGTVAPDEPTTTLPLTQTPEYLASNSACPDGLAELGAVPLSEALPEYSVTLVPYIELADATVMAFDNVVTASAALGSADGNDRVPGDASGGFVGDRQGRIWRFSPHPTEADGSDVGSRVAAVGTAPVADFSSNTAAEHDQGLVGMTFGPQGRLWINRTDQRGSSVLTVLTPTADRTALERGFSDVLEVKQTNAQHNGGDLVFDTDGLLYVSFGDGGGLGDPRHHGQNLATPLGAVLRFAVDTADSADPSRWRLVPAPGNPDLGPGSDTRIWVYGARNPFRISFDAPTETLWVSDVGQQCVEEVTVLSLSEAGANLGWNVYEGSRRFLAEEFIGAEPTSHRLPDLEYRHGRGLCAIIGGHVYRGSELEWLRGRYVFADLCGGDLYAAAVAPGTQSDDVLHLGVKTPRPVGFAVDGAGEMYVIDLETGVWRLTG